MGEAAAVEFSAFLKVWRELPHPKAVIDDPENASALISLCGSLYRMADDVNHGTIVSYAMRLGDHPSQEALQGKFGIRYRIVTVPDADHFMARHPARYSSASGARLHRMS